MYSRHVASVVILSLVLSLGVLSRMPMLYSQNSINMRDSFVLSDTLDLVFSTYLGGSVYDSISDIKLDSNGDIYVVGTTESTNLPTTEDAFQRSHSGGNYWEFEDSFIIKLSGNGQEILYCSYLGGTNNDDSLGVAIDSQSCIYVVGRTNSVDFPIANAYDSSYNGGGDCFVTKFTPNGSKILFSTYIGGSGGDQAFDFEIDSYGNCIVVGSTSSTDLPVITTNQQPVCHSEAGSSDGFVLKLSSDGSELEYSMYLGGNKYDMCQDVDLSSNGAVFVGSSTGSIDFPVKRALDDHLDGVSDCALTKLNASGHILYSTFFGGDDSDHIGHIELDDTGLVYASGETYGGSFPIVGVSNPLFNGTRGIFLAIINLENKQVVYSSVMMNTDTEEGGSGVTTIIVTSEHEVWISGCTDCIHFSTTEDAIDSHIEGQEGFLAMIDPTSCSLNYSSFFGGSDYDIILDLEINDAGDVYGVGYTDSPDILTKNALYADKLGSEHDQDGFVFRFRIEDTSTTPPEIVNVAIAAASIVSAVIIIAAIVLKSRSK